MRRTAHTDRDRFRAVAAAAPAGARVPVERRVAVDDPFAAYRRARDGPGGVFYETTGGQSGWGYFGVDPVEQLTVSGEAVAFGGGEGANPGGRNDAVDLAGIRALDPDGVVVSPGPGTPAEAGVSTAVFAGLPDRLRVGRYHSLCVEREDLPDELVETARIEGEREVVMGVRHRERPHVGVQFHPKSLLTPRGKRLVENFVAGCEP